MCRSRVIVLPVGVLVERLTGGVMSRGPPGEVLPATHDHIDISGAELETAADAAGHFGRDHTRAGAEKWVIDRLAGPAVIGDRADRGLRAVTAPMTALALAHRVPAGFMLPVIIAAAQGEVLLDPDDLGA